MREGDQVVAPINALMPRFPLVVATQDWHPAEHGSFAVNNPGRAIGELATLAGLPQVMWPAHCVQTTPGAEFSADLHTHEFDAIVPKGTDPAIDSYSGFFDNGRRQATRPRRTVKARGSAAALCLRAGDRLLRESHRARRGARSDMKFALIRDACRGVDLRAGDSDRAIAELAAAGVQIVDVMRFWGDH